MRAKHKKTLRELFVKKAKLAAGLYYDDKERGLALRVQASGHRSYYFVYNVRGRTRWYHIGWVNLSDARKIAAKLRLAVVEGRDPAADRMADRSAGTFAELASRYVNEYAKKHNKSWRQAEYLVRAHLLPRLGRLVAKTITRADIRAVIGAIESPTVANQILASASAIFSWGIKQEVVTVNPVRGVERNRTRSRERVLSDTEVELFWPHLTPPLRVILLTGQRPGEVLNMRREHIRDNWWELPGAPDPALGWPGTKNSQSHRVWLPRAAREIIGDGESGCVFARVELDAVMRDICESLGVRDKVTPHDLRRTHGTTITGRGFGRDAMDRIQNHRRATTTSVYDRHGYSVEDRRIMETVAQRVLALAQGRPDGVVIRASF
jgi:integrase